jgi:hypothetical protein
MIVGPLGEATGALGRAICVGCSPMFGFIGPGPGPGC